MTTTWICDGCGLEHPQLSEAPPLDGCVLDRGPVSDEELGDLGSHTCQWHTLKELAAQPDSTEYRDHGRGVHSFRRTPRLGIGQWTFLVSNPDGNLLWDPPAIPLSTRTVQRLLDALEAVEFDRLYTRGGDAI